MPADFDAPIIAPPATETIVIPIVAGIGNALMAEPMVRQLREARPDARVVCVAISKPIGEVVRRVPGVEVVVTGGGTKNLIKGIRQTRELRADVYLVPFPSNRWQYNLMARASGATRVVMHGYPIGKWSAAGFLVGNRVVATRGIHDVDQNLRLLEALDITPRLMDAPRFPLTHADRQDAAFWIDQTLGLHEPFVVMHAGSARTILAEAKRWPIEQYAELAVAIRRQTNLRVIAVEGPDESGLAQSIQQAAGADGPDVFRLKGSLGQSAAFIERAEFYVGTDSGLAHLAAAVGRPAITLFAPADPDRVCPFGNRDLVVQPPGLTELAFLYPWESTKPKLRPGMIHQIRGITVDRVMQKVQVVRGTL